MARKSMIAAAALMMAVTGAADVLRMAEAIVVDGRLDEAVWGKATWEGDFSLLKIAKQVPITGQTKFAVLADERTVYVGVKAEQGPHMKALSEKPTRAIFACDDIEVFLSPSGSSFMFYQFAAGVKGGVRAALFHSEGGATHPDPYAPEWKYEVTLTDTGYTMEIAIPLSALYMDRNESWSDEWLFNVARSNFSGCRENTSWSPLKKNFADVDHFRKLKGFPKRRAEEDVCMREASVKILRKSSKGMEGTMKVKAYVAKPGAFSFESSYCTTTDVELKRGENTFSVPCLFPKNATYEVPMALVRKDDGTKCCRGYPVFVDFDSIAIRLTTPCYADNFYPGQSTARIDGTVSCALEGKVEVSVADADGRTVGSVEPQQGAFAFDLPDAVRFPVTVRAACAGEARTKTVRKIEPNGRRMAWIDHGVIVVDGKPTFRRNFYGGSPKRGYRCSDRYLERMRNVNLYITDEVSYGFTLETGRLLKSEAEARKDEPPTKEFLALVDRQLELAKEKDFAYYYLCDEPECRSVSPVYLRYVYDYVKARDPYHLILIVSRAAEKYVNCADWIECHGYLNPYDDDGVRKYFTPMNRMGAFLEEYVKLGRPDKVIGATPQAFTYEGSSPTADYPTFDEYVCNVWTYLVNGAKSLYPFIFNCVGERPSLEEAVKYTQGMVADLEDILLFGERNRLVRSNAFECAKWELKGEKLFAVVNLTEKQQTVKVAGLDAGTYREYRGVRSFEVGAGETEFALKPFEVVVGSNNPKRGALMPMREEFAANAEAREYVRLHRDNQILMKQRELEVSASGPKIAANLLMNGVYDDWAAERPLQGVNPWIEMAFPDEAIAFKSVLLWGENIEKAVVKARVRGDWQELKPVKSSFDAKLGCLALDFGEVCRTVKVRFEFHKGSVKPSEIEFPFVEAAAE